MSLFERTAELDALATAAGETTAGAGRVVVVEGPPGIGKTALLGAAREAAAERGLTVLAARGGELELEFAFGVVRQLFEPRLMRAEAEERKVVLGGAASLAGSLFGFGAPAAPEPPERFALLHGLYWLAAGLAAESPLAFVVDDAHWADEPSLQWLHFLARRIEGLPILVVIAARSTRPEAPVASIEAIRGEPGTLALRPPPLSRESSGRLLAEVFGEAPDSAFVRACHDASGGNPFLLTELAAALRAEGVAPDERGGVHVEATNPAAIASLALVRLGHLDADARAMAVAAAVLGDGVELRDAAALAELDEAAAGAAADVLTAAGFLAGGRPLRFGHPLIRAAVHGDLEEADRARRHKQAAVVLSRRGTSPERVAAHLLLAEPAGEAWIAQELVAAAATAMDRGAPITATRYLRRALAEDVAEMRAGLLTALGSAEAQAFDAAGVSHLTEARTLAEGVSERVRIARLLANLLVRLGRVEEAVGTLIAELEEVSPADRDLRLCLEADLAGILHYGVDGAVELLEQTLARAPAELAGATPAERSLLAARACRAAKAGRDAATVIADAETALECGLLEDEGPASPAWSNAVFALVAADADSARRWLEASMRRCAETGTRFGTALNANLLAMLTFQAGVLADAEAYGWESVRVAREAGVGFGIPAALAALADALCELDRAEEAWREIVADGFDTALPDLSTCAILCESRGRVRLARHEAECGLADLLEAGERFRRAGVAGPGFTSWRAHAAETLVVLGRRDDARELAEEAVAAALAFARPRPLGIALRALGLALDGEAAIERLREAVAVLAPSSARLEHARALCDLGGALRRANSRREGRQALAEAADLAVRCGAVSLAERASAELRATGARPRRLLLSGVESLTASELRVARLAADGLTNREIAQRLFVTGKTVEKHLSSAYAKLRIGSRDELGEVLVSS